MQDDDNVKVIQYADKPQHRKEWAKYADQIRSSPTRLFITIADECHWGPTACQAHDKMVNDYTDKPDVIQQDLLECKNHIVLLVSATPFNVLSQNSRLPEKYVVTKFPALAGNARFQQLQLQDIVAKNRSVLLVCHELGAYTCTSVTLILTA